MAISTIKAFLDPPEEVRKFAPKEKPRTDPTDQAGQALIAMLQEAGRLSEENCDRMMAMAQKLSMELRAAQDRIGQLETDLQHYRVRAEGAEKWLELIHHEIEERLLVPLTDLRREQALH